VGLLVPGKDVRMSGKRRKYTPEFREQAARLVIETGRWVRLARAADDAGNTGAVLDADERAELERLRRESAELRLDREFFKKAAFFVSEQNR
jgi:transposase